MIMKIELGQFNIAHDTFLHKLTKDLEVGVRTKSGSDEKDIVRVWTDSRDWQFSLLGEVVHQSFQPNKVEIQSFGNSVKYIKLTVVRSNVQFQLDMLKLSPNFAELAAVTEDEAKIFLEGYLQSTVNLTLTKELFDYYATDKDQKSWLEF
jgi:hypothetical protein